MPIKTPFIIFFLGYMFPSLSMSWCTFVLKTSANCYIDSPRFSLEGNSINPTRENQIVTSFLFETEFLNGRDLRLDCNYLERVPSTSTLIINGTDLIATARQSLESLFNNRKCLSFRFPDLLAECYLLQAMWRFQNRSCWFQMMIY